MSLQRCQQETTSTEFLEWLVFIKKDINSFHRMDYFLANIAKMIVQVNSKNGKADMKDFLLKFITESEQQPSKTLTQHEINARDMASKAKWFTALGVVGKKGKSDVRKSPRNVSDPVRDGPDKVQRRPVGSRKKTSRGNPKS